MMLQKTKQTEPSLFLGGSGKGVVPGHYLVREKGAGKNANYFYLIIWVFSYDECKLIIRILHYFLFSGSQRQ